MFLAATCAPAAGLPARLSPSPGLPFAADDPAELRTLECVLAGRYPPHAVCAANAALAHDAWETARRWRDDWPDVPALVRLRDHLSDLEDFHRSAATATDRHFPADYRRSALADAEAAALRLGLPYDAYAGPAPDWARAGGHYGE